MNHVETADIYRKIRRKSKKHKLTPQESHAVGIWLDLQISITDIAAKLQAGHASRWPI